MPTSWPRRSRAWTTDLCAGNATAGPAAQAPSPVNDCVNDGVDDAACMKQAPWLGSRGACFVAATCRSSPAAPPCEDGEARAEEEDGGGLGDVDEAEGEAAEEKKESFSRMPRPRKRNPNRFPSCKLQFGVEPREGC